MNKVELLELMKKSLILIGQEKSIKKIEDAVKKDENVINGLARGIWTILNEKYIKANNQFNAYLSRKCEEYKYLSNLKVETIDKKALDKIVKEWEPSDTKLIKDNTEKINNFQALLIGFRKFEEEFFEDMNKFYKNELQKQAHDSNYSVMYHLEELQYLEPLAEGFIYRATKDDSMEL